MADQFQLWGKEGGPEEEKKGNKNESAVEAGESLFVACP